MRKLFIFCLYLIFGCCAYPIALIAQPQIGSSAPFDINSLSQMKFAGEDIGTQASRYISEAISGSLRAYQGKIDTALLAMETVQKVSSYIESLSQLFSDGQIEFPVGIKRGEDKKQDVNSSYYELIIHRLFRDDQTEKSSIYATCAFRLKESGRLVAFEGYATLEGSSGNSTNGVLELIAPVDIKLGSHSSVIICPGTKLRFGCSGFESFEARLGWVLTSNLIVPVDAQGKPSGTPLVSTFSGTFHDFEEYVVSLDINSTFMFKGLKDVLFTLRGATLDQSAKETPSSVSFPANYFSVSSIDEIRMWKGVHVSELSISLPALFRRSSDTTSGRRIVVSLNNALFDANGFSGALYARDIISSESIEPSSWGISLSDFSLALLKDHVVSFGFGGELNIPPFGRNSLLPYHASFNPSANEYEFKVNFSGEYDLPFLSSTVRLNELSSISLLIKDSDIYPVITASGTLSINAPIGSGSVFRIPDILFENMRISRSSPYFEIGTIGITGSVSAPSLCGFELSLNNIYPVNSSVKGAGIGFEAGISINDMFSGSVGIQLYGDYNRWRFREINVDKVKVKYESGAFSLKGLVQFKEGDAVYGDGFRGDIELKLLDKFTLQAIGVFGRRDDYRYFLADALFELSPSSGIIIPPALSFYAFGGGLYGRMQQQSRLSKSEPSAGAVDDFGRSLSGIVYVPDRNVGLGVMAVTKFASTGSANAFNGKVNFEIQFNRHGGLNFVQLHGELSVMDTPSKFGKLADNVSSYLGNLEPSSQPSRVDRDKLGVPSNKSSGFFTASINIEYDAVNSIFSADLNTYLNVAGIIRGIGDNDRLGWASAYFSPNKWYARMGVPSDRIGVNVLNLAEVNSYFMIGDEIPPLPLPPENVLRNLSVDKQDKLKRSNSESLSMGSGIAFGAGLEVDFRARLIPFYAHIGAGVGGEFMLVDLRGKTCANSSGVPGINGWYAKVQAWAYAQAEIGIEVSLFFTKLSLPILDISASALLQGSGPNPMYFSGAVGGRFSVLGGLVSGNCSFDFEIGTECRLVGGSPFGEEVIAEVTPSGGSTDISVFAAPQAIFNIPIEKEMTIDEEGGGRNTYKATLEEFRVRYKNATSIASGQPKLSSDGTVYMMDMSDPFESQKEVTVYAKVGFQKKINGQWRPVTGPDGKPVYEEKESEFRTGDRPKEILPEHVKYSYPVKSQYNFYPAESDGGYILVSKNYEYLFTVEKPEGFNQLLRISDVSGRSYENEFTFQTNPVGSDIRFEIDFSLAEVPFERDHIYRLSLVNVPQEHDASAKSNVTTSISSLEGVAGDVSVQTQKSTGTLLNLEERDIYSFNFRSSYYSAFAEKMNATRMESAVAWQEYPYVYNLISNIYDYSTPVEMFDMAELNPADVESRLVRVEPLYELTEWYTRHVKPLIYTDNLLRILGIDGLTPDVSHSSSYRTVSEINSLTNEMVETNTRAVLSRGGSLHYRTPYYVDRDYSRMKSELANLLVRTSIDDPSVASFLNADHIPLISNGTYPVKISYCLPGKQTVTSSVEKTITLTTF